MTTLQDKVFAVILTVITLAAFFGWLAIIASTLTFETKVFLSVFVMPMAFIVLAISSLKLIDLLIKE
jgi:amino acid permease